MDDAKVGLGNSYCSSLASRPVFVEYVAKKSQNVPHVPKFGVAVVPAASLELCVSTTTSKPPRTKKRDHGDCSRLNASHILVH